MALSLIPRPGGRPAMPWLPNGLRPQPPAAGRCPAPASPVLRLDGVGIGDISLSFTAAAGEMVHLCGGSPVARLRVMAMAAGFAAAGSGRCEIMGLDVHALDAAARRALRERHVARVLQCDLLPDNTPVLACVAAPLLRLGVPPDDAAARAAQELDALCAGHLAPLRTDVLGHGDSRLVLLARAMATRPRLLVVQQPEDALAPAAVVAVRLALWSLASGFGACVLMTSAHPHLVASADRCIDLDLGTAAATPWHGLAPQAAQRVAS